MLFDIQSKLHVKFEIDVCFSGEELKKLLVKRGYIDIICFSELSEKYGIDFNPNQGLFYYLLPVLRGRKDIRDVHLLPDGSDEMPLTIVELNDMGIR